MEVLKMLDQDKKRLDEQNVARRFAGLEQIMLKVRKCLTCGAMFESAGHKNCRHCDQSRREKARNLSSSFSLE